MNDLETTFLGPLQDMWSHVLSFVPTLLIVLLIFVAGLVFASLIQKIITRFLKLARLDSISEKVGIANILSKGDINYTLSEIIGVMIYWLIVLMVLVLSVDALQLKIAAELLLQVVLYVRNVIIAVFILVLGIFCGNVVANIVRTAAANAGVAQARSLGRFAQTIILIFAIIASLKQVGIDTSIIDLVIKAALFSLALGVGLAIGLGCKDIANRYVNQLIDSFKPRH